MRPQYKIQDLLLSLALIVLLLVFGAASAAAQEGDDDQLVLGAQVYAENCAVCHGMDGEGRVGATLAQNWPSIRPDLAARATIVEGVPGTAMPAWSQDNGGPLTEEQIDAVVAFILSWQTGGAPDIPAFPTITPHPQLSPIPEVEGDPYLGAPLYDYNCEVCHGPDGQGRVGTALTDTWGSIRPDLAMRSTIARGVPGTAMPGWSQQYGGPLTEEEINHLVAFILSLPSIEAPQPTTPATPVVSRWIGWGGLFLAVFLFTLIIAAILILQRRRS